MNYVEAPNKNIPPGHSLFLGGGISNCLDWQSIMKGLLEDAALTLINPRRSDFDVRDASMTEEQIAWEHEMLREATAIMFWFPDETLCPITLYELGAWSMTQKPLFVGTHPDYQRKVDVIYQTRLVRPEIVVVHSLRDMVKQIVEYFGID
jgi:hypothetical protein